MSSQTIHTLLQQDFHQEKIAFHKDSTELGPCMAHTPCDPCESKVKLKVNYLHTLKEIFLNTVTSQEKRKHTKIISVFPQIGLCCTLAPGPPGNPGGPAGPVGPWEETTKQRDILETVSPAHGSHIQHGNII